MADTEDQPTCRKGLAANSRLPAKMAQFLSSLADNLEVHMKTLDVQDQEGRREHQAYASLLSKYRQIVTDLNSAASEMAGYEDLPIAPHDEEALAAPKVIEVFRDYVDCIDIGYVLARSHWGNGYMPEAIRSLAETVLNNSGIFRIQAVCDVENHASQRALEKADFIQEGRLDRYLVHPNVSPEPRPCYIYARCG